MFDWRDVVKVSELLLFADHVKVFGGASSLMMARMVIPITTLRIPSVLSSVAARVCFVPS